MRPLPDFLQEVVRSYRMGLREALRPRLAFASLMVAFVAAASLLLMFVIWFAPIRHWSGHWVEQGLLRLWTAPGEVWVSVLTWLLMIGAYGLGVMLLMQVMIEVWLMQRIQSVCLSRHPMLVDRRQDGGFRHGVLDFARTFLAWAVGGLLCLMIPVVGGVLMLALSSYLSVRSLVHDSLQGMATDGELRDLIRASRIEMLALGLLIALTAFVPLVGFLVPVLAGASTCHLMMGRLERMIALETVTDGQR